MRIGVGFNELGLTLQEVIDQIGAAAEQGFDAAWLGHHYGWDPLTLLAAASPHAPGIGLGTAIVPTYSQHPVALASQALSVQAVTGNRLTLGVGLSHRPLVEGTLGRSFDRPARHMREYLTVLGPLLRGETVSYQGETLSASAKVDVPGALPPTLLVAALGPAMLRLTGELADGTVTMWAGPRAIADHVVPEITRTATGSPRIVAGLPVLVTADEAAGRAHIDEHLGIAGSLPSYRAILDREGAPTPGAASIVGDEDSVASQVRRLAEAGATDLIAFPMGGVGEQVRTLSVLAAL
ncbi:TIGR03564 family F420-dependent LLM class oxidoreductase [Allokutzneria oryzae]|uniref:TIGR03564 family F420-dependent LLM class oxidoreductase n=1 Tax=Allokutzneria oryzae TaxID=1378989 RepID=A0ABV5ZSY1_9PSEU